MPQSPSATKALRQSKRRALRNKRQRQRLHALVNKFEAALKDGQLQKAQTLLPQLYKKIDKSAKKQRLLKKNTAARRKSRLSKKLATALAHKKS